MSENTANRETVRKAFQAAFEELGKAMTPPESVHQHFREARKQFLMGVREIIDMRINRMSNTQSKGTQVPVD